MKTAVDHLCDLIRIPSVSSMSNCAVIEYAEESLRSFGWAAKRISYRDQANEEKINLIAAPFNQSLDEPDVELAFFCHTDTVPFAADWQHALDPWIGNGNVHGCGACDVKGFLACLLSAAARVEPQQFIRGLRIVLTADEEIGCIGAAKLIQSGAIRPKRAVIGEPTSLHAARAGKGYCLAKITVSGKEAHSAHPASGASAIYAAARLISAIEDLSRELSQQQHEFFDPGFTTINIGTIQGGTAKNIVPGRCEFLLEWRPIPGQPAEYVLDRVRQIIESFKAKDPGIGYDILPLRTQPGFETPEHAPLVKFIEELTGRPPASIPFGSEASLLSAIAEEVVVIGPGDMRTGHSNRECVPIAELEAAVQMITSLMREQ